MDVRAPRVVVTGGAGFIGSHLVDRLIATTSAEVVVIDNLSRGRVANLSQHEWAGRVEFVEGDVRNAALVAEVVRGSEVVFHLAAQAVSSRATTTVADTFTTNVVGTFNVLQALAASQCSSFVFASSRDVYGQPLALPVEEGAPLLATSTYGATKAAGEALCRAYRQDFGVPCSVLRIADTYGTRDFERIVPSWFEQAFTGKLLDVWGGNEVLDWVWVGHVVDALVATTTITESLPPINVASGTGTKMVDLARRIARIAERPGQIKLHAPPLDASTRFVASVERMRRMLHIEPPLDPLDQLAAVAADIRPLAFA